MTPDREEALRLARRRVAELEASGQPPLTMYGKVCVALLDCERDLANAREVLERVARWLRTGQVAEADNYVSQPHLPTCRPWHSDGCRCGREDMERIVDAALRSLDGEKS